MLYIKPSCKSFSETDMVGVAQTQYPSLYFQEVGRNNTSVPADYTQIEVNHPEIYRVV